MKAIREHETTKRYLNNLNKGFYNTQQRFFTIALDMDNRHYIVRLKKIDGVWNVYDYR